MRPRAVTAYAIGSIGTGGFGTLPGLVLVFYLTDTLGVAAVVAGAVVTIAKVWDVLIDPVIGARSDRALARTGSRRGMMRLGAVTIPLFFAATFAVAPGLGPGFSALWVLIGFVATATAFSVFQVPYIALPAELAHGYDDRTRLLTWRVVVLSIAILLFGAGGPLLRRLGGDDEYLGYLIMALVAGVVIGAAFLVSSRVAPRTGAVAPGVRASAGDRVEAEGIRSTYAAGWAALRESQPFRSLLGTFLLQGVATGAMLAGGNYVAVWVLESDDALTFLFLALIAPAVIAAPVWGRIAQRVGKERAFFAASVIFALAAASLCAMIALPGPWVYLPVALAGAAYAGMQSLPMAMLPDVIAHDALATGRSRAGVFGGLWTAGETVGMALGATALTVILAVTGYRESVGNAVVTQSAESVIGIAVSFSLLPAALVAVSLATLARYRIRREDLEHTPEGSSV